jgi:hypothetical protein
MTTPVAHATGKKMETSDCTLVYDDQDLDSSKVSTHLDGVITSAGMGSIHHVTTSSTEAELLEEEEKLPGRHSLVIIMSERMMTSQGKKLWKRMLNAKERGRSKRVAVVMQIVETQGLPPELQRYQLMDYNKSTFASDFTDLVASMC